jgi:ribonucleoside-diphosphate reductase alpha chain
MCNLTTINGAALRQTDDFLVACVHAAFIGTLQAGYTDIAYLGPVTRYLNERDALLGVSICGFMDNPDLLFDSALLERGARLVRASNAIVAEAIGIRPAARVSEEKRAAEAMGESEVRFLKNSRPRPRRGGAPWRLGIPRF